MHPRDDDPRPQADRSSKTISRIIPSAPMSPDGKHAYPNPSLTAKVVVWGGVALGVAGATAAAMLAARKIAGMIADDAPSGRPRRYEGPNDRALAPRFADLDEDEQEEIRRRVRAQARADDREAARLRADAASRRNPPRGNFAKDLTQTANDLSAGLEGVTKSAVSAFQSFRNIAGQTSGIIGEFVAAADLVRSALRDRDTGMPERDEAPEPGDPRTHRL